MTNISDQDEQLLNMTSDIVSAHVANNNVAVSDLTKLIENVHGALHALVDGASPKPKQTPAVPVKESVKADHLICLKCGAKMKMLKRHLRTNHKMTPDEYRRKWGLPESYSMVCSNYAAKRSQLAKDFGLGKHRS